MPDYRYLLADALTGTLADELPLDVSTYSQQINGVGALTGTLPIGDMPAALDWKAATTPRRALLIALRDEQIVWAGMVIKRRPTKDSTVAELGAETLEGYLGRRRIKSDLTQTAQDMFDIVRAIVTQLQTVTGGNVRLAVSAGSAGSTQTITYLGKDRTKALDAINRLTEVAPGFEYTVTWARAGGVFTPTLLLAAPALSATTDAVLLEFPGSLASPVDDPEDGGDAPNAVTGVGADSGGTPLTYEAVDTTGELASGYPIFEDEVSLKDETDAARLQSRTTTALAAKLNDHIVPQVELRPPERDTDLQFGDFPLGAPVRLRCTCLYHRIRADGSPGLDVTSRRVTGWTVTPTPAEKVVLNLGTVTGLITPPKRDRDIAADLRDVNRRLLAIETRT